MKEATPDQMRLFRRRQGIAGVTSIILTLIWGAFFVWLVLHHKIQDWGTTFIIGCCVLMVVKLAFQFLYFRCPACGRTFSLGFRWTRRCGSCETHYAA